MEVFTRMNSGEVNDSDKLYFREWADKNPQLLHAYHELEDLWGDLGIITERLPLREMIEGEPEDDIEQRIQPGRKVHRPVWAIAACLVLVAVFSFTHFSKEQVRYRTDRGERLVVNLSDGSSVQLNSMTDMEVQFSNGQRTILLLDGEALFNVAHDRQRKFIVKTERGSVEAIGTEFNVSLLSGSTTVTVLEGKVLVSSQIPDAREEPAVATAGDQIKIDSTGEITSEEETEVEQVVAWTRGKLIFSGEPLGQAIEKVNFHSKHNINLKDVRLSQLPIYGVFNTGDPQGFLSALQEIYSVRVVEISENVTLLLPKDDS